METVEHCYDCGDLAKGLEQAAAFVRRVGESNVTLVCASEGAAGWNVDVVYTNPKLVAVTR